MKHYLRFMITLILATVWSLGGYAQETPEVTLDFTDSSNPWKLPNSYKKVMIYILILMVDIVFQFKAFHRGIVI